MNLKHFDQTYFTLFVVYLVKVVRCQFSKDTMRAQNDVDDLKSRKHNFRNQ